MQRFLLESTIWHDFSHIDGFVASYLEDGLACPLLLQIADELRAFDAVGGFLAGRDPRGPGGRRLAGVVSGLSRRGDTVPPPRPTVV